MYLNGRKFVIQFIDVKVVVLLLTGDAASGPQTVLIQLRLKARPILPANLSYRVTFFFFSPRSRSLLYLRLTVCLFVRQLEKPRTWRGGLFIVQPPVVVCAGLALVRLALTKGNFWKQNLSYTQIEDSRSRNLNPLSFYVCSIFDQSKATFNLSDGNQEQQLSSAFIQVELKSKLKQHNSCSFCSDWSNQNNSLAKSGQKWQRIWAHLCVCVWIVRFKRPHSARESRFYTDRLIANPFSCAGSRVLILFSDSNALLARPTQSNFNPRFRCFLSFSAWLTCCSLQSRLPSRAGSLETAAENFPIKWKANKSIDFRINPSASN